MFLYLILSIILISSAIIFNKKNKYSDVAYFAACALLIIVSILRDTSVGNDFHYYKDMFKTIGEHSFMHWESQVILVKKEYGWYFMNKGFFNYGTFFLYTLCFYLIMYYAIFKSIYEKSSVNLLSLMLFLLGGFYFASFNVMRQFFVFAIFLYSIRYIESKEFWKFFIILVLASQFHQSALFLIPFYFIRNFIWSKTFLIGLLLTSLVLGYLNIFEEIVPLINIQRLKSMIALQHKSFSILGYLTFALTTTVVIIFLFFTKDINSNKSLYMKFVVFGIILSNLVMHFQWLFRFSEIYFSPILIIAYPNVISECTKKSNKLILTSLLSVYSLSLFYLSLSNNSNGIVPYSFIFSKP